MGSSSRTHNLTNHGESEKNTSYVLSLLEREGENEIEGGKDGGERKEGIRGSAVKIEVFPSGVVSFSAVFVFLRGERVEDDKKAFVVAQSNAQTNPWFQKGKMSMCNAWKEHKVRTYFS